MFKKVKIKHTRGVVDLRVSSGELWDRVSYENVIDLRELDREEEEEEKKSKENLSDTKKEDVNDELKENEESILEEEMEKRERILKALNEAALREKYPLIPEKRAFGEPDTEEIIANAKKVTEDLDWLRQESMKESLERKLEGTYDLIRREIEGKERGGRRQD